MPGKPLERSGHLLGDGEAKVKRRLGIKNPEQGVEDGGWLMASGPAHWLRPSPSVNSCAEDGRTSSPSSRSWSLGPGVGSCAPWSGGFQGLSLHPGGSCAPRTPGFAHTCLDPSLDGVRWVTPPSP